MPRTLLPAALLLFAFLAMVISFGWTDLYHREFFHAGPAVLLYNLERIALAGIFCWVVYATGYGAICALGSARKPPAPAEQAVLGFATGIGIWFVILLVLGILNLYYRSLMIGLCASVICASFRHLNCLVRSVGHWSSAHRDRTAGEHKFALAGMAIIAVAALWVVLVKGLYPGGGGDYYTHYFYYYLDVVHSHGLRPNDVWYHYYYSKGAGPFFAGMLLTDPEAPELITCCLVLFAALAIASLLCRVAPRSLWPACGAALYLVFNLVPLIAGQGAGEFQKEHEDVCALFVFVAWALSMECLVPRVEKRSYRIMAAACAAGASILTLAAGVLLGFWFSLGLVYALLRRQTARIVNFAVLCAVTGLALSGMLLSNYFATGLPTDQALDLMLKFANLEKLADWGVIPQVITVAWIRQNYSVDAPALLSWTNLQQLFLFMRLQPLWPILASGIVGAVARPFYTALRPVPRTSFAQRLRMNFGPNRVFPGAVTVALVIGSLVASLALISAVVARVQSISYVRFSSFFFPLLVVFSVTAWVLCVERRSRELGSSRFFTIFLPIAFLISIPASWQISGNWGIRAYTATANAARFAFGHYSLADAYSHQADGQPYGGIEPGTFAAMKQVGPDIPIWSTNVDSYCMVPGCIIESVVSFKLSERLGEILTAPPARAREILQRAGLNYFLFSKKFALLDLLPYSQLFTPDVIGQYLAIKWTDGTTYLLTWSGPGTQPIDGSLLDAYSAARTRALTTFPSNTWFRFFDLSPYLGETMAKLESAPHPWTARDLVFAPRRDALKIVSATYGASCRSFHTPPWAPNWTGPGNVTAAIRDQCQETDRCTFRVDVNQLGDPASGCEKDFSVTYLCIFGGDSSSHSIYIPSEANGKAVILNCAPSSSRSPPP